MDKNLEDATGVLGYKLKHTGFVKEEDKQALSLAIKTMENYAKLKMENVRLKAEKDHLRGIKFVPDMQSWENLTQENKRLKDLIVKGWRKRKTLLDKITKVRDMLAQPVDRISHVTLESYGKLRAAILSLLGEK